MADLWNNGDPLSDLKEFIDKVSNEVGLVSRPHMSQAVFDALCNRLVAEYDPPLTPPEIDKLRQRVREYIVIF